MATTADGLDITELADGDLDFRYAPAGTAYATYMTAAKFTLDDQDPVFPILSFTEGKVTVTTGFASFVRTVGSRSTGPVDVTRRTKNTIMIAGAFAQISENVRAVVKDLKAGPGGVGWVPNPSNAITQWTVLIDLPGPTDDVLYRVAVPAGQFTEDNAEEYQAGNASNIPFSFKGVKLPGQPIYQIVKLTRPTS